MKSDLWDSIKYLINKVIFKIFQLDKECKKMKHIKKIITIAFTISATLIILHNSILKAQEKTCSDEYLKNLWNCVPENIFTIGDKTYTRDDFIRYAVTKYSSLMMTMIDQKKAKQLAPGLLKEMLETEILLLCAAEDGITPSEELALKEMDSRFKSMNKIEKENFNQFLKKKNKTFEEYKEKICSKKSNQIQAAINFWIKNFVNTQVNLTDKDVRKYYESCAELVTTSHIQIKPDSQSPEDLLKAKKKAEAIKKKISAGEPFEKFIDESSCNNSNIEEFGRGEMVKSYEDAAFNLKKDEVSDVVKTPLGYYIIKLKSKKTVKQPPFEQVKDKVRAELQRLREEDILINKTQEMKQKKNVKVY